MEEVIARRSRSAARGWKAGLVIGIVCIIAGLALLAVRVEGCNFTFVQDYAAELLAAKIILPSTGVIMIIISVVLKMRADKVPVNIVTYRDGILYFYDGYSCAIEDVTSVRCDCAVHNMGDFGYARDDSGELTVVIGSTEKVCGMVDEVKKVNDRLQRLMIDCRERASIKLDYKKD